MPTSALTAERFHAHAFSILQLPEIALLRFQGAIAMRSKSSISHCRPGELIGAMQVRTKLFAAVQAEGQLATRVGRA